LERPPAAAGTYATARLANAQAVRPGPVPHGGGRAVPGACPRSPPCAGRRAASSAASVTTPGRRTATTPSRNRAACSGGWRP